MKLLYKGSFIEDSLKCSCSDWILMWWVRALGKVEQFQTQGGNYSLITSQPGSNNLTPKQEIQTRMDTTLKMQGKLVCHRSHTFVRGYNSTAESVFLLCKEWKVFCHTAGYSLNTIFDCQKHSLPTLLDCRTRQCKNQQQTNKKQQ